jgi:hypothetical protein
METPSGFQQENEPIITSTSVYAIIAEYFSTHSRILFEDDPSYGDDNNNNNNNNSNN